MELDSSLEALCINSDPSKIDSFAAQIGGCHTEFILTSFPNFINLFVTQYKKIGNLYQVKIDQPEDIAGITEPVYSITTIFGTDNFEAEAGVRYIAERLKVRKPLLLSLSLKNFRKDILDAIIEVVQEHRKEGIS